MRTEANTIAATRARDWDRMRPALVQTPQPRPQSPAASSTTWGIKLSSPGRRVETQGTTATTGWTKWIGSASRSVIVDPLRRLSYAASARCHGHDHHHLDCQG